WALLREDTTPEPIGDVTVRRAAYLRAPGLSGEDAIYVQFRVYEQPGANLYMLETRGAIAHHPDLPFDTQSGVSPPHWTPRSPSPIGLHLVANGRRVIGVARCGQNYEAFHAGFMLPNSRSKQYPYPLLVGGSASSATTRT